MTGDNKIQQRIADNQREFDSLKNDTSYTQKIFCTDKAGSQAMMYDGVVKFDKKNGGLLAIHKDHCFDPTIGAFGIPRGYYEIISAKLLFDDGKKVILGSEKSLEWVKVPDGLLDDKLFEIKGVEGNGKRNIEYKIREASQKNAEIIVLYYHNKNIFSKQNMVDDYCSYCRNSKNKTVKSVYYIVDGRLYQL
jgi:hypothetical protein